MLSGILSVSLAFLLFQAHPKLQRRVPDPVADAEKDKDEDKEKDENAPIEYTYNPTKAEKEITVGNYYSKKGNFPAAVRRYEEAAKWRPDWSEPYMKLGLVFEKKGDYSRAAEAYKKYLQMNPQEKNAAQLRRKIERLEKEDAKENK